MSTHSPLRSPRGIVAGIADIALDLLRVRAHRMYVEKVAGGVRLPLRHGHAVAGIVASALTRQVVDGATGASAQRTLLDLTPVEPGRKVFVEAGAPFTANAPLAADCLGRAVPATADDVVVLRATDVAAEQGAVVGAVFV